MVVRSSDYSVPLPAGWTDRSVTTVAAPPTASGYVPNVVVTREPLCDGMGLGGFADGYANLVREHASEFDVLATEHAELDGQRALVRTVRWRVEGQPAVVQLQAFCVRGAYGYGLVGTAAEDGFDDVEPAFRDVLRGFRFTADS